MRTSDFDYELPPDRIAQRPARRRTASRLLCLPAAGPLRHLGFGDLPALLRPGDLLVRNVTRVIPARIFARRESPGSGSVELLVLPPDAGAAAGNRAFEALTRPAVPPGRRLRAGDDGVLLEVGEPTGGGRREVRIVEGAADPIELAKRVGEMPLPPYIRRAPESSDRDRYQTVYARIPGSAAAPTAGLHFDRRMFLRLAARGVEVADIVLHVGHGTFAPIRDEDPRRHRPGAETYAVPAATRRAVRAALDGGRRVVAVGTTSVRVLETPEALAPGAGRGRTGLFILPGHRFRVVSALLTNFHLPKSSLLMLAAAFAGRARVLAAYREAVQEGYRFHSYGDAMFLDRFPGASRAGLEPPPAPDSGRAPHC